MATQLVHVRAASTLSSHLPRPAQPRYPRSHKFPHLQPSCPLSPSPPTTLCWAPPVFPLPGKCCLAPAHSLLLPQGAVLLVCCSCCAGSFPHPHPAVSLHGQTPPIASPHVFNGPSLQKPCQAGRRSQPAAAPRRQSSCSRPPCGWPRCTRGHPRGRACTPCRTGGTCPGLTPTPACSLRSSRTRRPWPRRRSARAGRRTRPGRAAACTAAPGSRCTRSL
mmetsp:Transcript_25114/g.63687  ORF Transcript_25114/g.63687 Transcript_25114/m.63687 type:complete len:220 (+) Transcript_25114:213-872(+)